jgi:predicted nucleic acid-binding protein
MTVIVSDTSPIRCLAHLELLHLLQELYVEVTVPPAVADELAHGRSQPHCDVAALGFVTIRAPQSEKNLADLSRQVDPGEAEAIALALESGATLLLIDEVRGRRVANRLGLNVVGTAGMLLEAQERGLVSSAADCLIRLRDENAFYVSDTLLRHVRNVINQPNPSDP